MTLDAGMSLVRPRVWKDDPPVEMCLTDSVGDGAWRLDHLAYSRPQSHGQMNRCGVKRRVDSGLWSSTDGDFPRTAESADTVSVVAATIVARTLSHEPRFAPTEEKRRIF